MYEYIINVQSQVHMYTFGCASVQSDQSLYIHNERFLSRLYKISVLRTAVRLGAMLFIYVNNVEMLTVLAHRNRINILLNQGLLNHALMYIKHTKNVCKQFKFRSDCGDYS